MKTLNHLSTLLVTLLILTSCEKEPLTPLVDPNNTNVTIVNDNPTVTPSSYNIEGTNWVLYSGRVYVDNLSNGESYYYDHFGPSKNTSDLDIFGGSESAVDGLVRLQTQWYFSNGTFILNGTDYYDCTDYIANNDTVYNIIGVPPYGSSRMVNVLSISDDRMTVLTNERVESNSGDNYNYYSTLTFVKAGTTCNNCLTSTYPSYIYGGIVNNITTPVPVNQILVGSEWVVTQYNVNNTTYYPNDTLEFIGTSSYEINGGSFRNYTINEGAGNNLLTLTLWDCSTLGGNYSGQISALDITDGEFNNVTFNGQLGTSGTVKVWMTKL
jgi:hypothetical protein|tara:strand:- start:1143 stop:2117 length:975 start_codon:yes stop_codon:yes gene_type:complete